LKVRSPREGLLIACSPTRDAVSGSLALCADHFLSLPSDPAVTGNALAIRIVFPLVGATPVSFNRPGLHATLGNRVGGGVAPAVLPHHRAYGSVHGDSCQHVPLLTSIPDVL